jgi:hypothetical protein
MNQVPEQIATSQAGRCSFPQSRETDQHRSGGYAADGVSDSNAVHKQRICAGLILVMAESEIDQLGLLIGACTNFCPAVWRPAFARSASRSSREFYRRGQNARRTSPTYSQRLDAWCSRAVLYSMGVERRKG